MNNISTGQAIFTVIIEGPMPFWMPFLLNVFGLSALTDVPLFWAMCGILTAVYVVANYVLFASGLLKLDENMSLRGICSGILLGSFGASLLNLAVVSISAYLLSIRMMVPATTELTGNLFQFMFTSGLHFTSAITTSYNIMFYGYRAVSSDTLANDVSDGNRLTSSQETTSSTSPVSYSLSGHTYRSHIPIDSAIMPTQ